MFNKRVLHYWISNWISCTTNRKMYLPISYTRTYLSHTHVPVYLIHTYLTISYTRTKPISYTRTYLSQTHVPNYLKHTYTYLSHILTMYYYKQCRYIFQRWCESLVTTVRYIQLGKKILMSQ